MNNLIHDIVNDPREYAPFLIMLGVLLLLWLVLSLCGLASIGSFKRRRKFWYAIPPLLLGAVCVLAQIPISLDAQDFHLHFDLRWAFILPLLLGLAGVALWWRAGRLAQQSVDYQI